ncbi:hypothetical protein IMG5_189070 [Ichthyophthirius multifiliis]|uniref:Uncharacterized protein n=1 Tax=Ichthyophthirius multifiliis TaxID=5932 RepID=G0R422_ICHMU|nr:hypothetical protein IMG5_189070 [Ichthyophthirius multifiliis]EGR27783.1 hypothetical protein IMG5_189070 [Ichthyophthirius multifiliis]|eukprot:XP_004026850.1 hypothetical protein IMG5_189070 [Ichthyophthirius multifiliis]
MNFQFQQENEDENEWEEEGEEDEEEEDYKEDNEKKNANNIKDNDTQKLYDILGVDKKADINEIRKSFKKACIKGEYRHPDKGGDPEKFKLLNQAYEILQDAEKRDIYDKYGLDGLKQGGGAGGNDPFDIFKQFFGGGDDQRSQGQRKAKPKQISVEVSLQDVYKGKVLKTKFKRKRPCEKCEGKGGANAKVCTICKGQRYVIKMVKLGPNTYSQSQSVCDTCQGKGDIIKDEDICQCCKGLKIVENEREIEVPIEPGVPDQYNCLFTGEADEGPGIMAGDLYVKIIIKKHNVFERIGADLYIDQEISLLEALGNVYFEVKHLDDSILKVASRDYIHNGKIMSIKKKGMPFYKDKFDYGNLYIRFKVIFPKELSPQLMNSLKQILPGKQQNLINKNKQFEYMQDFHECDMNQNPKGGQHKNAEDDDYEDAQDAHQTQHVQCGQQ